MPASELTLLIFIEHLYERNLKGSTITGHLSAIRHLHLINGFHDPLEGRERLTLAKRGISKQAVPSEVRAAVTNTHLRSIFDLVNLLDFDDAGFFAMCCLGFFGFLRISELTYPANSSGASDFLTSADLSWTTDKLTVLLRRSKGDPLRLGVRIAIGRNSSPVCALKSVQHYLNLRRELFPDHNLSTLPLFVDRGGSAITKSVFSSRLSDLASAVGVEGKVSPHSLRIGAATAAWRAGYSDSQIQALGRWKSRSFMRYLRIDSNSLARLNARLGELL